MVSQVLVLLMLLRQNVFLHSLKTELVAVLDSPGFPALSIIRNTTPNFPARIYANED